MVLVEGRNSRGRAWACMDNVFAMARTHGKAGRQKTLCHSSAHFGHVWTAESRLADHLIKEGDNPKKEHTKRNDVAPEDPYFLHPILRPRALLSPLP